MPDPLEDLHTLREQTDVLLQQTEAVQARLGPVDATDSTGQVTVKVAPNGMLEQVQVGFTWDQHLTKDELGPAVIEAVSAASMVRIEQYGAAATEVEREPAPRARPASPAYEISDLGDRFAATGDEGAAAAEFFEDVLNEAIENIDEADRLVEEHSSRMHTGRSSSGHVRANVSSSGHLMSLEIDQAWIQSAHPANVGREITQAIRSGIERSLREGLAAALKASKLAQVAAKATGRAPATPTREV